jgi:hypothetical protein
MIIISYEDPAFQISQDSVKNPSQNPTSEMSPIRKSYWQTERGELNKIKLMMSKN